MLTERYTTNVGSNVANVGNANPKFGSLVCDSLSGIIEVLSIRNHLPGVASFPAPPRGSVTGKRGVGMASTATAGGDLGSASATAATGATNFLFVSGAGLVADCSNVWSGHPHS